MLQVLNRAADMAPYSLKLASTPMPTLRWALTAAQTARSKTTLGVYMKILRTAALTASALCMASAALAQALTLQPADPQPDTADLSPGLAVEYSSKFGGRALEEIETEVKKWSQGPALAGLSYDTADGDIVMTSETATKVAAKISGYINFESAGTYVLEFLSNDGLEISIGNEVVGLYDGVHDCGYVGEIEVEVPVAGYYAVDALYFQRKGGACLLMEWGPDSDGLEQVPDSAFFH